MKRSIVFLMYMSNLQEGAKIIVISRISEDWLYGEYNGRKGQFPVNYVNRLPHNI